MRSLFVEVPARGAFCVTGDFILGIEEGGWLLHNLGFRMEGRKYDEKADLDAIERRLLSICQVAATLQKKNRLYTSVTGGRKE